MLNKHCMDYLVCDALSLGSSEFTKPDHVIISVWFYLQMKNADYFSNYVTEDFTTYINRKRKNNCHGNHIEMQAMAEMYNRPVEVYQYGTGRSAQGRICIMVSIKFNYAHLTIL